MYVLSAADIREWDQFTIEQEPIASIDLMERAATCCFAWIKQQGWQHKQFYIFCGKGNNGGDGLVLARQLVQSGFSICVYIIGSEDDTGSSDFQQNLIRLKDINAELFFLDSTENLTQPYKDSIIIDALFGTGLNKPLSGTAAAVTDVINKSGAKVISIDLPSGLFADRSSLGNKIVKAHYTLTLQTYKLALLVAENENFTGKVIVIDIGLHPSFEPATIDVPRIITDELIIDLYKPRSSFAHKGSFGHSLLMGGSQGKMGAMVLAVRACLHAGAGLTTALIPGCGYTIIQITAPEAMAIVDPDENQLTVVPHEMDKYQAMGIGPGMGNTEKTYEVMKAVLRQYKKHMVVDADALNCLAANKELLDDLPHQAILTPHPKEFDRLFGDHVSDFDRIETARKTAIKQNCIIILKGHHTLIAGPNFQYFNNNGNAGMAKGGSGDALTGIITALLAQGYLPMTAAILGVYIHGAAGDVAAVNYSQEAMSPSDLIQCIGQVYLRINALKSVTKSSD